MKHHGCRYSDNQSPNPKKFTAGESREHNKKRGNSQSISQNLGCYEPVNKLVCEKGGKSYRQHISKKGSLKKRQGRGNDHSKTTSKVRYKICCPGYYRDQKVALGHNRLAIIDLETGAQPISNEDDSIWIIFNGEIFNYLELASELSRLGHIFKTKSDTETVVHAYEQWGTSCFERFNGQWALSLWDRRNDRIILSRDRLGVRPLYYTICQNRVLFASEVKALFADKRVGRDFDPAGFSEIFSFWSPVAPRTAFKNIKEVEPGHFLIIGNKRIKNKSYWTISFPRAAAGEPNGTLDLADIRNSLRALMWRHVGVERTEASLREALDAVEGWCRYVLPRQFADPPGWQLQNMLEVARLMIHAAIDRRETRGVHYRADHPATSDTWRRHIAWRRGRPEPVLEPVLEPVR